MWNSNKKSRREDQASDNENFIEVNIYNGETKDCKRNGRGIYFYPNGDIYEGEWRKSQKYGHGGYIYSEGQRLEGFFYHDKYIGKEPNENIRKRMAKEQRIDDDNDNFSTTEETEESFCGLNYPAPDFKIKADGAEHRRAASVKRNAWLRQKYGLNSKD